MWVCCRTFISRCDKQRLAQSVVNNKKGIVLFLSKFSTMLISSRGQLDVSSLPKNPPLFYCLFFLPGMSICDPYSEPCPRLTRIELQSPLHQAIHRRAAAPVRITLGLLLSPWAVKSCWCRSNATEDIHNRSPKNIRFRPANAQITGDQKEGSTIGQMVR